MSVEDLSLRRVTKQTDNTKITPVDLLKKILHDIETGETKADAVLVLMIAGANDPDDPNWDRTTYRAGMSYQTEICLLELAKKRAVERWVGE